MLGTAFEVLASSKVVPELSLLVGLRRKQALRVSKKKREIRMDCVLLQFCRCLAEQGYFVLKITEFFAFLSR